MSEMIDRLGKAIGAALARGPKRECLLICNDEQQEFLALAAIEAINSSEMDSFMIAVVMKLTGGTANPHVVESIIERVRVDGST